MKRTLLILSFLCFFSSNTIFAAEKMPPAGKGFDIVTFVQLWWQLVPVQWKVISAAGALGAVCAKDWVENHWLNETRRAVQETREEVGHVRDSVDGMATQLGEVKESVKKTRTVLEDQITEARTTLALAVTTVATTQKTQHKLTTKQLKALQAELELARGSVDRNAALLETVVNQVAELPPTTRVEQLVQQIVNGSVGRTERSLTSFITTRTLDPEERQGLVAMRTDLTRLRERIDAVHAIISSSLPGGEGGSSSGSAGQLQLEAPEQKKS